MPEDKSLYQRMLVQLRASISTCVAPVLLTLQGEALWPFASLHAFDDSGNPVGDSLGLGFDLENGMV